MNHWSGSWRAKKVSETWKSAIVVQMSKKVRKWDLEMRSCMNPDSNIILERLTWKSQQKGLVNKCE